MSTLSVVVPLFWLQLASANPIAESVELADGWHVGQELGDLLRILQEETSVSRELSQPGPPPLLDLASTGGDRVEYSRPDNCDSRQVVGEMTAKGFCLRSDISTPSPGSSQWIERDPLNMPGCLDPSFVTGHWGVSR